jgi:hypothetical protein
MTEHYRKHAINPIDVIVDHGLCFNLGNVIKYVLRHKYKDGQKDLAKALWYLVHYMTKNSDTADGVIKMISEQIAPAANYNNDIIIEGTRNWGKDFYSKLTGDDWADNLQTTVFNHMLDESNVKNLAYNTMLQHILTDVFMTVDWQLVARTIADDMERLS